ncbi:MAG: Ig-like domain-containing protein, partial [Leptolyngbyaceae cyanobacterium]
YTPDAGFRGTDSFTYEVSDGALTDTATVTVNVSDVNEAPTAADDSFTIDEDATLSDSVAANDVDPDGDALTFSVTSDVSNGELVFNADGSFDYTPAADFNGADSFTYEVTDGEFTATATADITINPVNDAPVAQDDVAGTSENTATTIDVLANDSDVDGDALTVSAGTAGNGTTEVNADGTVTYTPDAGFSGTDSFTYEVSDGALTDTATVTVNVSDVNGAPTAADDSFTIDEDTVLSDTVAANDTDPDGDVLTFALEAGAANGAVDLNADGTFTYTPDADFFGTDSFTYTVSDGELTDTATVNIEVNDVVDTNIVTESFDFIVPSGDLAGEVGNVDITFDTALVDPTVAQQNIPLLDITFNLAGETLTLADDADGANVQFELGEFNGSDFATTAVPANDTFISVSFEVGANGPDIGSFALVDNDFQVIDVELGLVNLPPVAVDDSFTIDEDTVLTGDVAANDSDLDGDDLTFTLGDAAANGAVDLNADGTFIYTPDADFFGTDSFTYTVSDGELTDTATVNIEVVNVPDLIIENLDFIVPSGALEGEVGNVSITYDESLIDDSIAGLQNIPLEAIEFNLAGETLTLADDEDGANVQFENGEFNGTDFAVTTIPVNDTFISVSFEVGANGPDIGSFALVDNDFQVIDVDFGGVPAGSFEVALIDADTDTIVTAIADGTAIDASLIEGRSLTLAAFIPETSPLFGEVGSVRLDFNNGDEVQRENVEPYALFGDNGRGNFFGGDLDLLSENSLMLTAFENRNLSGEQLDKVTINFTVVSDPIEPPVPTNDALTVTESEGLGDIDINVLDNDVSGTGAPIAVVGVGPDGSGNVGDPIHAEDGGTFIINADGSVDFDAEDDFEALSVGETATTSIEFAVGYADGVGPVVTSQLTVTVEGENDSPVAVDDEAVLDGESVTIDVLANDSDPDASDVLEIIEFTAPASGEVVLQNGVLIYTANDSFVDSDSFEYTVSDGNGGTDTATVTVTQDIVGDNLVTVGLFDADTDTLIDEIEDGSQIEVAPGQNLTISVSVEQDDLLFGQVESVFLDLNNGDATRRENAEPYALFGDNGRGNLFGGSIPTGDNTIDLDIFSQNNLNGDQLGELTLNFTLVEVA